MTTTARTRGTLVLISLCAFLAACTPASSAPPTGGGQAPTGQTQATPRAPKVLRVAVAREPDGLVLSFASNPSRAGGGIQAVGFPANRLQITDDRGRKLPELAEALPSLAEGSWRINPDGTMETTWRLRANVKWHDGHPMTADDLVFGYQLLKASGITTTAGPMLRAIRDVAATGPHTAVVSWSQPFVTADEPGDNLPVLPKHLLEAHLANPESVSNLAYWTTEYVGTGPFKLDRWEPGDRIELVAFEDYFRGRPKLDRVIFRIIPDANTQVANILSGEVDVTLPTGIDTDTALSVKDRWAGTRNQVLLASSGQLRHAAPQSRPGVMRPAALADPRIRQALYRALDRQAISEAVSRGVSPPADSFVPPFYDFYKDLESAVPQFPFDPIAAQQQFAELGWTRGADGILRNAQGEEFRIETTGGQSGRIEREMNATALGWKQVGIQVDFNVFPQATANDNEARSLYPGVETGGSTFEVFLTSRKSCAAIPAPNNQWRGTNRSGYCNREYEDLITRLQTTIPPDQRLVLLREAVRVFTLDMAVFPYYWEVDPILHVAGVKNVPPPSAPTQLHTWNTHEWDKE